MVAVTVDEELTVVAVATIAAVVGVVTIAAVGVVFAATAVVGVLLTVVGVAAISPQAASSPTSMIMTRVIEIFCPNLCLRFITSSS